MKIWTALFLALCAGQAAHAQDIVIGQSVPLSGSNADIGRDMRDGALAVFARANASNTLSRRVQLVTLDNANNRQRAAANSQQLVDQGALVLFGYNSATNSLDAVPLAARHNMLFFAPFSGSSALRNHPNVYTIRASYKAEAARIVETKRTVGSDKAVVIYYDDDDVGLGNYEAVAAAFTDGGLPKPPGVAVKRGMKLERAVLDQIAKEAPHYVLATTQFGVVRDVLTLGTAVPVAALSFVNPDELAESMGEVARGTVVSQVVPSPRLSSQTSIPVVKDCADALATFNGGKLNYTSLESCIAAKTLLVALKRAGNSPTRDSVLQAMGSLGRVDVGGFVLNFSAGNHHGSQWVDLTMLSRGNRFVQ